MKIPIIAVYTKYDLLVKQFYKDEHASKTKEERLSSANKKAAVDFERAVEGLQEVWRGSHKSQPADQPLSCIKVLIQEKWHDDKGLFVSLLLLRFIDAIHNIEKMLSDLMAVTQEKLHPVERELQAFGRSHGTNKN